MQRQLYLMDTLGLRDSLRKDKYETPSLIFRTPHRSVLAVNGMVEMFAGLSRSGLIHGHRKARNKTPGCRWPGGGGQVLRESWVFLPVWGLECVMSTPEGMLRVVTSLTPRLQGCRGTVCSGGAAGTHCCWTWLHTAARDCGAGGEKAKVITPDQEEKLTVDSNVLSATLVDKASCWGYCAEEMFKGSNSILQSMWYSARKEVRDSEQRCPQFPSLLVCTAWPGLPAPLAVEWGDWDEFWPKGCWHK